MTAPAHVSHSQLGSWLRCGEQYRLERIVGVPQTPAWYLVGGKAFHNAVERTLRYGVTEPSVWHKAWDEALADQLGYTDLPTTEWRAAGRGTKDKPNGEDGVWWEVNGAFMFRAWCDWWEAAQVDYEVAMFNTPGVFVDGNPAVFAVEMDVEGSFAGLPIKAYIDTVFLMKHNGGYMVVDWKTGTRKPSSPTQLGLYAALLEQRGLPRPEYGAYYMARRGELLIPEELGLYTQDYFDRTFARFARAKEHDVYVPNVGTNCGTCSVRDFCWAVGGSEERVAT